MPASQRLAMLKNTPGVKSDELKYTCTADMLAAKGDQPVTKAELQDHLERNKVQIGEVTKGDLPWEKLPGETQWNLVDQWGLTPQETREAYEHRRAGGEGEMDIPHLPRYAQYQLPGGANYREKLLTL